MTTTTAFDMKKALITRSKLIPALAHLVAEDAIWDSSYSGTARPRQLLWFGEILWTSDDNATFGKHPVSRNEEYNIRFGIEVNDLDEYQIDANDKVEVIMTEIETMCANDYRLFGIGGLISVGVVPIGLGEGPGGADGGRAAFLAAQVNVIARK
jgi:hypothetical protein